MRPRQISSVTSGSSGAASARERLEHRVERVERVAGRRRPPRTGRATAAHVPVGEHVAEVAQRVPRRAGSRSPRGRSVTASTSSRGLGEQVAVEHVGRVGAPRRRRSRPRGGVGVEARRSIRAPERQQELAHALADALLGDDEVAAADAPSSTSGTSASHPRRRGRRPRRRRGSCAATSTSSARRCRARCRG